MINNRYKVLRQIGEGRSKVYQCNDLKYDYIYAMKIISPSLAEEEFQKFAAEYYTIRNFNHPGIIKAYEYGTVFESETEDIPPGSRYILLEYFDGVELAEKKYLSDDEIRKIIIQIASVLQYLHQSYYVYYDLKPENILIADLNGETVIKLIDFGFARTINGDDNDIRGTAEYIAPELLKKEPYDHRVDYYSFGIMLYKLIYGCFPFDNSTEIKIFRAQLEDNFQYPQNNYSSGVNNILKKLLQKDPELRYLYAMQIYSDLSFTPDPGIIATWIPARKFSGRRDIINILNNYLINYNGGDVFIIQGSEGSGKTALLSHFAEKNPGTIYIDNAKTRFGIDFIKDLLEKVLYNENVYLNIPPRLRDAIKTLRAEPSRKIIDEVKGLFSTIIRSCRFIMVIDDFNLLDELSVELFREIIPLFQVHNIKLIITENSDRTYITGFIHNQHQLNLSPFTETQLQEYTDNTFYNYYPKEDLKKIILHYSDLLPGSIESFVQDLLISGILCYREDNIHLVSNEDTLNILRQSHDYFYRMRTGNLSDEELDFARMLAAYRNIPGIKLLSNFTKDSQGTPESILLNLRNKNILHLSGDLKNIDFTSVGMKEYLYNTIPEKKRFHCQIASLLEVYSPANIKEIAFQYESACEYQKSRHYYQLMYEEALRTDAFTYQKTLLEHIVSFPLAEEEKNKLKFELCNVLQKSGDYVSALELINELLLYNSDTGILNELMLLKGLCHIGSGDPAEGIKQVEPLVDILEDEGRKHNLQTEMASAYLDMNNYPEAERMCLEIIDNDFSGEEVKAKCNNLLGIISIHRDNDFTNAYKYFQSSEQIYSAAGIKFGKAQMQLNLANINSARGEPEEAERLFRSSLELNSAIGNLQHEAQVLLNTGVHYMEYSEYDKSIIYYRRALDIFSNTGDIKGGGLTNSNLGEIYYLTCNYTEALRHAKEARYIFQKIQDANEELESLFLTGKIYTEIGCHENINRTISEFEKLLRNQVAKHEYNYRFLKVLTKKKSLNFFHEIKDIIRYYSGQGDLKNYFQASITAVKFLYDHQLYKEALEMISSDELVAASGFTKYFEAEWNLCFGLIINETGSNDVQPSEYYLKAYNIIENLSISALTWKITSVLAEFYHQRGNSLRAEEFAYYTKSLLEYISENTDDSLVKCYQNKKEVKEAMKLCNKVLG
jgi:serine/threonine protein kinase/Tfp pilus assembly protein PilF